MMPLVFLPGARGTASFWRPVADRLADLGPIHLFGWPSFGGIPADPSIHSLEYLFGRLVERLPSGASHVIAQSMGGVLAVRLALEHPERVARLVLVATSGGVEVGRLGGADWRPEYRAALPDVPAWFLEDRTDLTDRLGETRARTLLLWSDSDPASPLSVAHFLAETERIPAARTGHRDRWDAPLRQRAARRDRRGHQKIAHGRQEPPESRKRREVPGALIPPGRG
jgi:pimeloyl-ACP methyl ester carboxylesterase